MDFKPNPDFEKQMAEQLRGVTQEAVDVTARAHHEHGEQDVEGHLKSQMAQRGVEVTDEEWLAEMAGHIRESQVVIVTDDDEADS